MPSRSLSSKRALDDSHLVLRRRPVERSGSCLHFTPLDSPSIEHIATRNISNRTHNSLPSIRDGDFQASPVNCLPPIRAPNESLVRVNSETRSHVSPAAKPEPFVATTSKSDLGSLCRKPSSKKQTGVTVSKQAGQSKIADNAQTAGFILNTRKSDPGLLLKTSDTKKSGTADGFSFVSTSSSSKKEGSKEHVGRCLEGNRLLNTGLEKKFTRNGAGRQVQPLKTHQSGVGSRETSSQQWLKHSMSAWPSLGPYQQISLNDTKHFEGKSTAPEFHHLELQGSHGGNTGIKEIASPPLEREHEVGGHSRSNFLAGLERIASSFLSTREQFFVEGSFNIKFRSWITFVFLTVLILSCAAMVLKILYLKMEITRLHASLRRCTSVEFDMVTKDGTNERLQNISDLALGKSLSRTALVVVMLVPFLWRKKTAQLWELSRNFIAGTEEDAPIGKRVAYGVDILFSTRSYMKPTALLFATLLLICGGGIALFAVSEDSLEDAMWRSWTYVADSGNHADSEGTLPRIVSVLISFGGMLIFALMLGLISDAISEKVDSLRKGKSEVLESGHTLILGWSDKLGSLLKQLSIANQSLGGGVVVVLAERDKEEMELDIAKLEFDFMGTSVICRSGSPLIMADLKKVSVSKARAIIVLAEIDNADQSDARALRVVLSLTGIKEGLRGHIVVEMRDLDNEAIVKLVGGEMVETVVAHDVIGRLMIQCARQPGLAQIWEDILGFEKAEFYIKRWPELDGMCFGEVLISFPDAVPCGVKVHAEGGRIFINPDDDYVLCEGDEILVIAEDDDSYSPGPLPQVLDAFLAPGSELWIFSDVPECDREKKLLYGNLNPDTLENIKLVHREGNTVIRRHLESLPLEDYDSILILADEKLEDTVVNADSSSLATLLLIRDIQSKRLPLEVSKGSQNRASVQSQSSWIREMHEASNKTIIISEILDSRTKNLVSVSKISDYVLSNELVSMALAMVAEDKQINRVLEELFAEEGNELYIRPAEFYLYDQEEVSFFEIMIRARQREEIVIGYRKAAMDQAVINPLDKDRVQRWTLQDVFIVLAFEE